MAEIQQSAVSIEPQEALRLVDFLRREAKNQGDARVKKVLLAAGCQIAEIPLADDGIIQAA